MRIACTGCDWHGPIAQRQACPACGASLAVEYPGERPAWGNGLPGVWRYRSWLPAASTTAAVTLGEGDTPLLRTALDPEADVLLKLESTNPTLSFKDRPVSVAATMARELGADGLVCASTGNTGVAVAAYAARAGLPAVCIVPERTPAAKRALIAGAGARLLAVRGTFSDAHALARAAADGSAWANLTTTYLNPFMLEGNKTVAFELLTQLEGAFPSDVVVPVGAGPLLGGLAKGFAELRAAGVGPERSPALHAVQGDGCAPIVRGFETGTPVRPWAAEAATAAGSIADPLIGYPEDGQRTLDAVLASGGAAVGVSDGQLRQASTELAVTVGVSVELGAAAALAGYRRLQELGHIDAGATTVLVMTGHGAKDGGSVTEAPTLDVVEPHDTERALEALGAAHDG